MKSRIDSQLSPAERALTLRSVLDLPFIHDYSLDAFTILELSELTRLGDLNSKNVVVVDTLRTLAHTTPENFFSLDDVARSLAPALRQAAATRQAVWLCAVHLDDLPAVKKILGENLVHHVGLGDDLDGSHSGFIPIAISPASLIESWAEGSPQQRHCLKVMMEGTDTLVMKSRVIHALRSVGAEIIERHVLGRWLSNPKVIAYLIVLVYSSLRALPVVFVPGFHGKVWMLWTIDLVTAIPYTWGIIELFAGKKFWRRMVGLVVTIVTFISPYIYFWFNGRDYPMWVNVFVGGMIVAALAVEYSRWLRDKIVAHGCYGRVD